MHPADSAGSQEPLATPFEQWMHPSVAEEHSLRQSDTQDWFAGHTTAPASQPAHVATTNSPHRKDPPSASGTLGKPDSFGSVDGEGEEASPASDRFSLHAEPTKLTPQPATTAPTATMPAVVLRMSRRTKNLPCH